MMAGADDRSVHVPVQVDTVLRFLEPKDGATYGDFTVGAGGHAAAILGAAPCASLVGVDQDAAILAFARDRLSAFGDRVHLVHQSFGEFVDSNEFSRRRWDGILIDLGVSSFQLDQAERGFSFDRDGPLDMRMNQSAARTAADLVNRGSRDELLHAIRDLGEEPRALRVVDAIVQARREAPILRTCELAEIVERAAARTRHHHGATRTFLGLRMAVNDEAGVLEQTLPRVIDALAPGARLVVIAFHGREDRIVKLAFKDAKRTGDVRILTPKPVWADPREVRDNPRSRSSRIRAVERIGDRFGEADRVGER